MKSIWAVAFILILAVGVMGVFAEPPELPVDSRGAKMQVHAPSAGKDQILGVASTTIDMSDDLSWAVYSPVDCKYRTMTSAAKQGVQKTIPAETWHVRGVRKGSAFTNFSGCTLGQLERM